MTNDLPNDPALRFAPAFQYSVSSANMSSSDEHPQSLSPPATTPSYSIPTFSSAYPADLIPKWHHRTFTDSAAGSTDSSPTTTISTVDDSSGTEPSPSSSPESPPPTNFALGMYRPRTAGDTRPFFELQKQPPPRKGRNLKNLAVNTSRQPGRPAPTTGGFTLPAMTATGTSNGASTTFVKPPTPSKRRTNQLGLTLLTPGLNTSAPQDAGIAIPPTPSHMRPGLRHFQSSPSLPLVAAVTSRRDGHPFAYQLQPTLDTILSPVETQIFQRDTDEEERNFDIPLSREEKPEAYPDGPICVYEPFIDLYLEPTAEQAREYDVIMNVAGEVRNPLLGNGEQPLGDTAVRLDGGGGIQYAPKRDRLGAYASAAENADDSSPSTTPKATPRTDTFFKSSTTIGSKPDPEYIHIPWEHNSDIVPDLPGLCKTIDEKINQQKRILIHCQCGVSRSASLVVAYGLYKNPSLSVQEAYDAVKSKSKWIGPNMNLIMQLQEFRTRLVRGGSDSRILSPSTPGSALSEWSYPFASNFSQASPLTSVTSPNGIPLTKAQTIDAPPSLSPGPSSAPSGQPWSLERPTPAAGRPRAVSALKPGSAYVDPMGKILPAVPLLNVVGPAPIEASPIVSEPGRHEGDSDDADAATPTGTPLSPRSDEFAMGPLQPSPEVHSDDKFGLMSPTSMEFSTGLFDRSALLAQLGMGSVSQGDGMADASPRRSISLRSAAPSATQKKADPATSDSTTPRPRPMLRGKVSSPTLREQHHLQALQAQISAQRRAASRPAQPVQPPPTDFMEDALLSPRATEFTSNPFALALESSGNVGLGLTHGWSADLPLRRPLTADNPQMDNGHGHSIAVHARVIGEQEDPRSPALKGGSPIVRSIFDVL